MYKTPETMVSEAYDRTKDYCESRKWELWEANVRVYKKFLKENYPEKSKDPDFAEYKIPVPKKVCDFIENLTREENAEIKAGFVAERLNSLKLRDPECPIVGVPSFDAKEFEPKECHWGDYPIHSVGGKRGDGGHIQPDWEKLLKLGLCGILNEIDEWEKINSHKPYFYETGRTAIKGVISYIKRCENLCREKGFLKEAEVCRNLQTQAPKTFHEAVQLMFFMHIAFWHGEDDYWLCYGRFDALLIDFYNNDIKSGVITREKALELITYYFISLATTVNPHNGMSLLIGGKDRKGNFVYNEVSRLVLESRQKYHIDNPAVSLAYYEGIDEEFVNNVCNSLDSGTLAFFNGDLIERGLKNLGVSEEDAHIWGTQTCEEIGLLGCSNIWSVSPVMPAPVYLLEVLESIKDNIYIGKIEEIKELYKARLGFEIDRGAYQNQKDWILDVQGKCAHPLLNCFVEDCLKKGLDYMGEGARYNWVCNDIVGLITVSDSLYALDQIVFKKKLCSLSEFWNVLQHNFEGYEEILGEIRKLKMFGNGNEEADAFAKEIYEFAKDRTEKNTVCGHPYIFGAFGYLFHVWHGNYTGATPDGRKKGEAFSDGIGAAQGRDTEGPTSLLNSVFKINQEDMLGGTVLNLKFDRSLYSQKKSFQAIKSIIETYMKNGGFQTQINITDAEELKKAQKDPDNYRHIIVRVAGYSDYFTALEKSCQDEIIRRSTL